jgi:outer membrane protein
MIKKSLLFLFLLILPIFLFAQDKMVLTLEQSVEIALERNPGVQIAEKELVKAKVGIWEAYSALLPTLDASANFQRSWKIQETTIPNFIKAMLGPDFPGVSDMPDFVRLSFALENTFTYGATLTQPLFLGGAGITGIQMACAVRDAAQYDLDSKRQNLIYQTADAFYGCLLARELVEVQTKALDQAEANLDLVIKKVDVGSASKFDRMRAEVEAANLKPAVISARNDYQAALTGLRMILGLDKNTMIDLQGALEYVPDDYAGISLADLQAQAVKTRPELHALISQKRMASKGVVLARSEFLPKLFFSTDYSYLAMRNDYKFTSDDFSKGFTSALSLQIPLFHGFKTCKQYQKARLDYKIALDTEKLTRDGIATEVEIAYNKFKESSEKYQAAKESISLAEEALRLANLMYEEGVHTQLDVLNSQLALTQSRLNYATALYEYQMARYDLRRVTGLLTSVL